MSTKSKKTFLSILILLFTLLTSSVAVATEDVKRFEPTPQPLTNYNDARDSGQPIILEFYANW